MPSVPNARRVAASTLALGAVTDAGDREILRFLETTEMVTGSQEGAGI